jgi:hypothetical protein
VFYGHKTAVVARGEADGNKPTTAVEGPQNTLLSRVERNRHKMLKNIFKCTVAPIIFERNPQCEQTILKLKIICKVEDTNTRIYIQQSRLSAFMLRSMGNENHSLQSRSQVKERLPSYPYLF